MKGRLVNAHSDPLSWPFLLCKSSERKLAKVHLIECKGKWDSQENKSWQL